MAADPVPAYARAARARGCAGAGAARAPRRRASPSWSRRPSTRALAAPEPDPATAMRPVFAPVAKRRSRHALGQTERRRPALSNSTSTDASAPPAGEAAEEGEPAAMAAFTGAAAGGKRAGEVTYLDAIHQALREEMERDPAVVLLGQDIAAFEGAFRVTRGLYARWPERVLDTPIAESGALGLAAGAALLGFRPVVEMQFADFVSNGFNQIVNVARQALLPLRGALPGRGAAALGRRRRRRALPLAEPRGVVRSARRAQGGLPGDRARRQGAAQGRDPRSQPGRSSASTSSSTGGSRRCCRPASWWGRSARRGWRARGAISP